MPSKEENPYRPIEAQVLEVIPETPTIITIRFRPKELMEFRTGQFVAITIPGSGEAFFTPSSRPSVKEIMEVTVMKVGKVTSKIHLLKPGDIIGVRGPLGNGYPTDKFKNREVLVVGGGCGFAPIRSLMYTLFEMRGELKNLIFRGGCKNPRELVYKNEISEWPKQHALDFKITVDKSEEGWQGNVGLVTTILENLEMDCPGGIAIVCGPPIMMKFVTLKLLGLGFKEDNLYLSMEKNMSCGIGKCGHCRLGTYYCCKDGPVFTYNQIKNFHELWD
jgi:NAD(P)H-flavin reductase